VAGFHLLRKIGEGGMSAVFQSYDVASGRTVAVKLLADHLASQPEFVGRFYREARLSRVLEHPNIVQGYASGFDPTSNKHFLVLEFIDGPTAHGVLTQSGPLPVGAVARIGIDIARALHFLHEQQYVHRDVKPDNILLRPDGVAKLADLGLTKRLNDDAQLTSIHQGVGTTYYMPYEQAVNANLVDGRSDIFALGATLYHLLTGDVPFLGTTHDEVIREKAQNSFRPLRTVNPDVPVELASLISAMLACDPRARIQSAGQVADALAAMQLACELPSYRHLQSSSAEHGTTPPSDHPTRADHRVPDSPPVDPPPTTPPTLPPVHNAFTPGVRASVRLLPEPPAGPRWLWPWVLGLGVAIALAAGYKLRARPMSVPAPTPGILVQEEVPVSPNSLPTAPSQ